MQLTLIHFNDVYHVLPGNQEPIGGAARFAALVKQSLAEAQGDAIVLFSGDAFNPSIESSITRGRHMPPVLNTLRISASCVGNHDFDFGIFNLQRLTASTNFPWLLANIVDENGKLIEGLEECVVLQGKNVRIGVVGLVEKDWIATIPSFPPNYTYTDAVETAKRVSRKLRDPNGEYRADIVVALTHMRVQNDVTFAQQCKDDIDLVLGGHDHTYYISKAIEIKGDAWDRQKNIQEQNGLDPEANDPQSGIRIVKSGTDFRTLSVIECTLSEPVDDDHGGKRRIIKSITATRKDATSNIPEDEEAGKIVETISEKVTSKTKRSIGYTHTPWEGRSQRMRTEETNLGDFAADLMLHSYTSTLEEGVDFALCCGGTFRSDSVLGPGEITIADIMNIFPFEDPIVVIRLSGKQTYDALENAVSMYPKQEGRFPQVGGLRFTWDPEAEPGKRIRSVLVRDRESITNVNPVRWIPLDMERMYVCVTRQYMAEGYDGFTSLKTTPENVMVDEESGMLFSTLFRRFFLGLKYVNAIRDHFQDECDIHRAVGRAAKHWLEKARAAKDKRKAAQDGEEDVLQGDEDIADDIEIAESMTSASEAESSSDVDSTKNLPNAKHHPLLRHRHHHPHQHHPLSPDNEDAAKQQGNAAVSSRGIKDAMHSSARNPPCYLGKSSESDEDDEMFGEERDDCKRHIDLTFLSSKSLTPSSSPNPVDWLKTWASVSPTVDGRISVYRRSN
ncbi:hypothetical protein BZG36_02569 [Bifiguratus adelaidae]|uniref:5'-Nucleotidase C-terminal domain-containing protein n=1 Tax=Bifiguratus adelaidae TaxID=1938954 RepID=A0A261Y109_9FUNG|nr:hypothetical protein BZG36_02569 [Bifiguratus adelaidae]